MTVDVFPAAAHHAALIHRITQAAYAEYAHDDALPFAAHTETLEDVEDALYSGGAVLAWLDGVVIGSARYHMAGDHFVIERVAVLPGFRGCGAASVMLCRLEDMAMSCGCATAELCSRLSLPRNLALYQRRGYEIEHVDNNGRVSLIKQLHPIMQLIPA
jgi:ribosomal protein S18 acetylase RimI-like enzyme